MQKSAKRKRSINLRPYQKEASAKAVEFFLSEAEYNAVEVLATGAGKSILVADIASKLKGGVLVFCPSKEILEQNYSKMCLYGYECSMYSASVGRKEISPITFATIGSVKGHPELFAEFKYIIIDECHLVNPEEGMYKDFLEALPVNVLGLTATPYRLVSKVEWNWREKKVESCKSELVMLTNFAKPIFSKIIYNIETSFLIKEGYLARLRYFSVQSKDWDERKLRSNTAHTDFSDKSVRQLQEKTNYKDWLVSVLRRLQMPKSGIKRKGVLVFVRFVEDAQYVCQNVSKSAYICGSTNKKERERILEEFKSGQIEVLANVGCLIVGYDRPDLDTVVLATPTMSLARYYQEVGRIIRPFEGKDGWVVDLCGNIRRFGDVGNITMQEYDGTWEVFCGLSQITGIEL